MIHTEVRRGAYYDSIVLMQLQRALLALEGVQDAGVVMGASASKQILQQSGLYTVEAEGAGPDDLVIVIRAVDASYAANAGGQIDALLTSRRSTDDGIAYRPKTLATAARMALDAGWVLVSVPGRYAVGVAEQAINLGKHVFLYSDNVAIADEVRLKTLAAAKGLLVMGPDCGTALVDGVGLGFANRVRRGPVGIVAASGTGLQYVASRIHQLGSGVSHALGTGGRDLSSSVGGITARQGVSLLARDPQTEVIVLISKPPAPEVGAAIMRGAIASGKSVVVHYIGNTVPSGRAPQDGTIRHANSLDEAAELAVTLGAAHAGRAAAVDPCSFAPGQRYLRGLYSGGTLAYEAQAVLSAMLPAVYSNAPLDPQHALPNPAASREHTVVDLGADEFTVGRLHPMLDADLRIRRLEQEANDPEVAVILLDVVLGYGAHPDMAAELAPAIHSARAHAIAHGRHLEVVAVVVGTDEDPQGLDRQVQELEAAGAVVFLNHSAAVRAAGEIAARLDTAPHNVPVDLDAINLPVQAINVGLESFAASLTEQGAIVYQVDWRPPAGGNERLMGILRQMGQPV